jgi:hypothetical protein
MQGNEAVSRLLHTVKYDKSTSFMDPKEELFFLHYLKNDPSIGEYIRSQLYRNPTFRKEILQQPVCPRCEGFMFFRDNGAQCPKCGTWVHESKTHSVKNHMRGGFHK